MRTPLSQIIYMLDFVTTTIAILPDSDPLKQARRYGKLMRSQLEFMSLFVEDLLNLKMLHDGVFKLNKQPFDPVEVFETICQIFGP